MSDRRLTASTQPITRMTIPMLMVLEVLLADEGWYGLRIAEATGLRIGTVYPILARFERAGWVTSRWEDKDDPGEENDPGARRKYYLLTPEGRELALAAIESRNKAWGKKSQASVSRPRPVFG
jgi:PadR family transcriptional regulator